MRFLLAPLLGFAGMFTLAVPCQQPLAPEFPPAGHKLIGDMVVPDDYGVGDGFHRLNTWPNAIVPYTFDPAYTTAQRTDVRDAMDLLEAFCGVRFVPKNISHPHWVEFTYSTVSDVSFSELGFRNSGRQRIWLWPSHFGLRILVCHEIMHTLAFLHEHQRPDRNTFVTVHYQNINSGDHPQFNIDNGGTTHGAYDLRSCMHYHEYAFSNNNQPTITVNPPFSGPIGYLDQISTGDTAALQALYGPAINPTLTHSLPEILPLQPATIQTVTMFGARFFKPTSYGHPQSAGTRVFWNGTPMSPSDVTVLGSSTIQLSVWPSLLQSPGIAVITVVNPVPGSPGAGLTSNSLTIRIPAPATATQWWGPGPRFGFGEALAIGDDLDDDGVREVLVGNPDNELNHVGRVWVMSPSSGTALVSIVDPNLNPAGRFGVALKDLGNIDNQPRSDFAVGNPGHNLGIGRVLVYSGDTFAAIRSLAPTGSNIAGFGTSIETVGDLNGDGRNEVAVGAPGVGGGGTVFVFNVAPTPPVLLFSFAPTTASPGFGHSLAHLGGNRIAVGAPFHSVPNNNTGQLSVWTLSSTSASLVFTATNGQPNERLGWSVASAGDLDGDGLAEIAVGAPWATSLNGFVLVYSGATGLRISFHNPSGNSHLGQVITNVGDIDGDGTDDLALGGWGGIIHLINPRPTPGVPPTPVTLLGTYQDLSLIGGFRGGLAGGRDIFGTGALDLVAGAPQAQNTTGGMGHVRIMPMALSRATNVGCSATGAPPRLGANGRPTIPNASYALQFTNSYPPGSSLIGGIWASNAPLANSPLSPGCFIFLQANATPIVSSVISSGVTWTHPLPIPNDPGLTFGVMLLQGFVLNGPSIDLTNALVLRLGQ